MIPLRELPGIPGLYFPVVQTSGCLCGSCLQGYTLALCCRSPTFSQEPQPSRILPHRPAASGLAQASGGQDSCLLPTSLAVTPGHIPPGLLAAPSLPPLFPREAWARWGWSSQSRAPRRLGKGPGDHGRRVPRVSLWWSLPGVHPCTPGGR